MTVAVVDRDTEAPLANADVHLGVHRASTDADGRARVDVPVGEYELYVRSPGYQPYAEPVTVTGDTPLRVAAARVSDADFDDDQVWM
ncbi:MAG: carboxypeptidase regulatory-like domain-containing protein [Acidobacteria bacterium]|nr:carboxypeptidase regulatory-like domain-containing protein [Acidobacteriota bacterium]